MSMRENENRAVTRERFSREACVVSYGGDSRGAGVAACVKVSRGAAEPQRLGGVVGGLANETTAQEAEGSKALRVSASRRENKSVNASRGAAEPQRLGGVVGGLASETTA